MTRYWTYTVRCGCCDRLIDYCVDKRTPYETFRRTTLSNPGPSFRPCDTCGGQTVQTLVAFDSDDPDDP